MPSPPISPTSLSPGSKMASLASILHHGSSSTGPNFTHTTRSTSSKSTPAPTTSTSTPLAHQHQYPSSPPPATGGGSGSGSIGGPPPYLSPLSPTTSSHHAATIHDLPFYHQLEQIQRVREGKLPTSSSGTAAPASAAVVPALPDAYYPGSANPADDDVDNSGGSGSLTPTTDPIAKVFARQLAEVDEAKEVLRKAGVFYGGSGGGGGGARWDQQQVKVQVQGDGRAKMRMMGAGEEADRDEGVRL